MSSAGLLADPAEVRKHLIAAAAAGEAITYADLLNALGHRFTRPKMRALCKVLAAVDDEAASRDEPELARAHGVATGRERGGGLRRPPVGRPSRPGLVGWRRRHCPRL